MTTINDSDLLLQRFYSHVKNRGDATFLTQPKDGAVTDYSFSEVCTEARKMAAYLESQDYPPQSQIAIVSKNCAHFIMAELAIWMAGHVSVALYPTLNQSTVSYILDHSEAKLLFVGKLDMWDEIKKGVPADLPQIAFPLAPPTDLPKWDDVLADVEPIEGMPTRAADDHSLIIYTSGSTGQPKGVLHSFATLSAPTVSLAKTLQGTSEDRVLSYLPLAHSMDRWLSECLGFYTGHHIYFAESLDTFVDDLGRARPTLFVSVPRLWLKFQLGIYAKMPKKRLDLLMKVPVLNGILKKVLVKKLGLDQVRFAGSGSAPIPADLINWYRELGLELLEGYGMSENFNFSHLTMPGRGRAGYIGHAHPGVDCKLSDEGEILIKSPGNMLGYYRQPEVTAATFTEDGYLRTGDRGAIDENGRLKITGRVKELFKTSKGKYVAPAPIENIINNDSRVELSLVGGSGQPKTHAVVQLAEDLLPKLSDNAVRDEITAAMDALIDTINNEVEEFERVGFIVLAKDRWTIESGELTPTMKIRRPFIEDLYTAKLDEWYASGERVIWE